VLRGFTRADPFTGHLKTTYPGCTFTGEAPFEGVRRAERLVCAELKATEGKLHFTLRGE
jgi:hypothetical protein